MTAAATTALILPGRGRRLVWWIEREALAIAVPLLLAAVVVAALPYTLGQDGWLALVAGREVVTGGLPDVERLTLAARGTAWVDQQWLAHLVLYGLAAIGGPAAALALNVLLVVGSFGTACVGARRLGASPTAVGGVAAVCMLGAPWSWQLRSQSLALPLFVAVLWFVAADARRPSRGILLVLPLLCLWANVHGSVLLGALLVLLYAGSRRRFVLAAATPLTVLASPYATSLPEYYRRVLFEADLSRYVTEWETPFRSAAAAPAVVLIAFVMCGVVYARARLPRTDALMLIVLLAAASAAARNAVWLQLGAVLLLPAALLTPAAGGNARRVRMMLVAATAAMLAVALAAAAGRSVERAWPAAAHAAVAGAAAEDPGLRVLADERHADWLLWKVPALSGRMGYDARLELYGGGELARYSRFLRAEPGWRDVARGYGLIVVAAERERLVRALAADPAYAVVLLDGEIGVFRKKRP